MSRARCECHWLNCLFLLIFIPPLMWLSLKSEDESSVQCSIEDFSISILQNDLINNTIQPHLYFDLKLKNNADDMGAYYDNITLTFYYYVNISSNVTSTIIPLANYIIPGFHQDIDHKDTHRKDFVSVSGGAPWRNDTSEVVTFRVDLATAVRFKEMFLMGSRYKLLGEANVTVNGTTGKKISDKSIKLKNMHNHHVSGWVTAGIVLVIICFFCHSALCGCVVLLCYRPCCGSNENAIATDGGVELTVPTSSDTTLTIPL